MQNSREPEDFRNVLVDNLLEIIGHGPGSFEIEPLPQDASMRRYYRIQGPEIKSNAVPDGTIVLMVLANPSPFAASEEIVKNSRDKNTAPPEPREEDLDFVNVLRHFESAGVPVPRLYKYDIKYGLLYLEDLGDKLLEDIQAELDDESRKKIYFEAIGQIVNLHRKATSLSNPGFVGFNRAFDEELLFRELMHYVDYGIEARKGIKVDAADIETITRHMRDISAEIAAEPRVVVHRDYQSRNLLLKDGRLRVIDFQDALMGTRQYDLVSLLRDSYVVLSRQLVSDCIERYCSLVEETTGESIDREHFLRIFHLQTLQRKIKDAGRFDYIDIVKKNPKFIKYIPDTLGYAREAFDALPEHRPMQELLAKYTPELKP